MKMILAVCAVVLALAAPALAADVKPRVIVVSDIGNEPDDSESFVRFLLYTNQLDPEGFVASTSTWQREIIHPELFLERIDGYEKVLKNLRAHDKAYPEASALRALVKKGQPHYGMSHVGDGFEEIEALAIVDVLRRANIEVIIAGLHPGQVTSIRNVRIIPDTTIDTVNSDEFDMIILPGGAGR